MFTATGWDLIEKEHEPAVVSNPINGSESLTILKVHEFDHARMTMSVIVRDNESRDLRVFCKVRIRF